VLGDPYSFPADLFLERLNEDSPGVPVLGGMASGARQPGQARLLGEGVRDEGAIGLLLEGDCGLRPIVSQGCRPIGRHMIVTKAEENVIVELSGLSPLERLREVYRALSPQEQALFQKGLHVGRVVSEYGGDFRQGDFLIRNVIGLERTSGTLIVGDRVRVGQTVQFQVRDAASAAEDLRALLHHDIASHAERPAAALVFTCNGRGSNLFGVPDHDAAAVRQAAGPVPLAGFFAGGEIGPVAGRNYVHGYTASVALFGGA
jgi:small ligand-binding sensory domain FIST